MPGLGLGEAAFGPLFPPIYGLLCAADLLVRPLEQFCQGEFNVGRDAFNFGQPLPAGLFEKGGKGMFVQPCRRLRFERDGRQVRRWVAGYQVHENRFATEIRRTASAFSFILLCVLCVSVVSR